MEAYSLCVKKKISIIFVLLDFVAALISWIIFVKIKHVYLFEFFLNLKYGYVLEGIIVSVFWLIFHSFIGSYYRIETKASLILILNHFFTSFIGVLLICFVFAPLKYRIDGYKKFLQLFFTYFSLHFFTLLISRILMIIYIKYLIKKGIIRFNTIIIGTGKNALDIWNELKKLKSKIGWYVLGNLYTNDSNKQLNHLTPLGHYTELDRIIPEMNINHVIIAVERHETTFLPSIFEVLNNYEVEISVIPELDDILMMVGSFSFHNQIKVPLLYLKKSDMPYWQKNFKRGMDILISLIVLIGGFPFLLIFALITKFTSKGPIFYVQERIGLNGIPFKMYKFRSMYVDSEANGPALSKAGDKRITPWGCFMRKTRIDELPQFFNVLMGDMSLVGPRPERKYYSDKIIAVAPEFKLRYKVKPGITSLAQVKYGYAENVDEMIKRLKYDIFYIKNRSLLLDFHILYLTIITVIKAEGK